MEANSLLQVQELHKKFQDLNDEISQALRHQEDALSATSTATSSSSVRAVRLVKRAFDWREDVHALAKHIDLQLQNSRALRAREAQVLIPADLKTSEEDDGAKLRCLRSDLRLLQEFRLAYLHSKGIDASNTAIDTEMKQVSDLVELSSKKEKSGGKEVQTPLIVQLFEARRELTSKISEDVVKDTKQFELDAGISELTGATTRTDRDLLASWDAQLYVELVQAMLDLQKELKDRFTSPFVSGVRTGQNVLSTQDEYSSTSMATGSSGSERSAHETLEDHDYRRQSIQPSTFSGGDNKSKAAVMSDEVHLTLQKLRREYADLKHTHAKVLLTNSQLGDDIAHLQRKYEDEKRAHMNEKKWYVPKIQKLEETVVTTSKALEELKLNVELITNMYKTLSQTLSTHVDEENELKDERDRITALLAHEIKKVAMLTKDGERKDCLVTIAMAARLEMCELAKRCEQNMLVMEKEKNIAVEKAKQLEDELAVTRLQLESAYSRLEATDNALRAAKTTIERMQHEMDVCLSAAQTKQDELKAYYDKEMSMLQQRFDKTKRELLDTMSQNLSLDGRLRKAQEKLNRLVNKANAKEGGASTEGKA
ncbi:hypothetical protein Poli38472_008901 [Pythium oligandrum]|uniref:Uncharacterized protein n=1 Tax=Pythium oligandrum TaxID=41045 RepID=A0A8K1C4G4_PYTOL|nr:hypothetical protein Poli38472_008901 [Pythium oligandrum]|eukprot:TMW56253.1 hypothetical protein Poli38472_008901 [Pythium oligandrum]